MSYKKITKTELEYLREYNHEIKTTHGYTIKFPKNSITSKIKNLDLSKLHSKSRKNLIKLEEMLGCQPPNSEELGLRC